MPRLSRSGSRRSPSNLMPLCGLGWLSFMNSSIESPKLCAPGNKPSNWRRIQALRRAPCYDWRGFTWKPDMLMPRCRHWMRRWLALLRRCCRGPVAAALNSTSPKGAQRPGGTSATFSGPYLSKRKRSGSIQRLATPGHIWLSFIGGRDVWQKSIGLKHGLLRSQQHRFRDNGCGEKRTRRVEVPTLSTLNDSTGPGHVGNTFTNLCQYVAEPAMRCATSNAKHDGRSPVGHRMTSRRSPRANIVAFPVDSTSETRD